jgi:hypothetical protein
MISRGIFHWEIIQSDIRANPRIFEIVEFLFAAGFRFCCPSNVGPMNKREVVEVSRVLA